MGRTGKSAACGLALVAALAMPIAVSAQDLASARAFAAKLYRAYERGDPSYLGRDADKTFAESLLRMSRPKNPRRCCAAGRAICARK